MRLDGHRSYDYYAVFVRRTPLRTHPRRDKPLRQSIVLHMNRQR